MFIRVLAKTCCYKDFRCRALLPVRRNIFAIFIVIIIAWGSIFDSNYYLVNLIKKENFGLLSSNTRDKRNFEG